MAINISVQYNGGLLPDIILLTQGYYQWGTRINTMQWLCIYSLCNVSPLIASKTLHGILRMYYILYFFGLLLTRACGVAMPVRSQNTKIIRLRTST